jgi:hypothetical protein
MASVCYQTRIEIDYFLKSSLTLRYTRPPGISTQILYALPGSGKLNTRNICTLELPHNTVSWLVCSLQGYRQRGSYTTWYSGTHTISRVLPNVKQGKILKDEGVTGKIWWSESFHEFALDALRTSFRNEALEMEIDWDPAANQDYEPDQTAG